MEKYGSSRARKKVDSEADYFGWDDESVDILLLYYLNNIDAFRGPLEEEIGNKWESIATQLSKPAESCLKQFEELEKKYHEHVQNDSDISVWPYFDIFTKISEYDGVSKCISKNDSIQDMTLLEYYQKHKRLFVTAQFGGKIRLWSIISGELGMTPEQCAYRFFTIKYNHRTLLEKLVDGKLKHSDSVFKQRYYRLCAKVFSQNTIETINIDPTMGLVKSKESTPMQNKYEPRILRWQHNEIRNLLNFFSDNFASFEDDFYPKQQWQPIALVLQRSETECIRKISELLKKHKNYRAMKEKNPLIKICWRYYDIIEELYRKNGKNLDTQDTNEEYILEDLEFSKLEETETACEAETVFDEELTSVAGDDSGVNDELIENDEDYVCIIVTPEDQNMESINENSPIESMECDAPALYSEAIKEIDDGDENVSVVRSAKYKWGKKASATLLRLYRSHIVKNRRQKINETDLWYTIGTQMDRLPNDCRNAFLQLKTKNFQSMQRVKRSEEVDWPHFKIFQAINCLKPVFTNEPVEPKKPKPEKPQQVPGIRDVVMKEDSIDKMLTYYVDHIQEFVSPKYNKMYVWAEMEKAVGEKMHHCKLKFNYLSHNYNELKVKNHKEDIVAWPYFDTFESISAKTKEVWKLNETDPTMVESEEKNELVGFDVWDEMETEKLLEWYLSKVQHFRNPKYIQKYLWREAELALGLSARRCSKKIRDIRRIYRLNLKLLQGGVKPDWNYFSVCSKIYGTDLDDPFLARTKRTPTEIIADSREQYMRDEHNLLALRKMRIYKKVMSKAIVERLINYYIKKYDELFKNPVGTMREAWKEFARKIGFTPLACEKKILLLKRQYRDMLEGKNKSLFMNWPYRRMMERLAACEESSEGNGAKE